MESVPPSSSKFVFEKQTNKQTHMVTVLAEFLMGNSIHTKAAIRLVQHLHGTVLLPKMVLNDPISGSSFPCVIFLLRTVGILGLSLK